jgi:hypothetical protein
MAELRQGMEEAPKLMADFYLARDTVSFVYASSDSLGLSRGDKKALAGTYEALGKVAEYFGGLMDVSEDSFKDALREGGSAVRRGSEAAGGG